MFVVDKETRQITMHRGDTGAITFTVTGMDWGSANVRALFSIKKGKETIKEEVCKLDASGKFTVNFLNSDTDWVKPGTYYFDVRVVKNPVIKTENGKEVGITDGDVVRTPWDPIPVNIKTTVGEI